MSNNFTNPICKNVRFVDSFSYPVFEVPDNSYVICGGKLKKVRYEDDYHFSLDNNVYHIRQFGKLMEQDKLMVETIHPEVAEQMSGLDHMHNILRISVTDNICVYFALHLEDYAYIAATKDGVFLSHKLVPLNYDSLVQSFKFFQDTLTINGLYFLENLYSNPIQTKALSYLCLEILDCLNDLYY